MNRMVIFGSRLYAPLRDVTRFVEDLPVETVIVAVGASDVAQVARETAAANGRRCEAIPLTAKADELYDAARQPETGVTVFAARDPETKEITERTGIEIAALRELGIVPDVRQSALTAQQGALYHRLESELRKLRDTPAARRSYRIKRVTDAGVQLWAAHDALMEWLEDNDTDPAIRRELVRQYRENAITQKTLDACNHGFSTWQRNYNRYLLIASLLNAAMDAIGDRDLARAAFRRAA